MGASLQHYGILGMRWGIRRSPEQLGHRSLKNGIRVYKDGRIEVDEGVSLQRLSRENGINPMHRTYASITKQDGVKYVAKYGRTDDRNYLIQMLAKEPLIAPSTREATSLFTETILSKQEWIESYVTSDRKRISSLGADTLRKDPSGKLATRLYLDFNGMLCSDPEILRDLGRIQDAFLSKLEQKGYNILLDDNDFRSGFAVAPILVLDPYKSLEVTEVSAITEHLKKASEQELRKCESLGDRAIEKLMLLKNNAL